MRGVAVENTTLMATDKSQTVTGNVTFDRNSMFCLVGDERWSEVTNFVGGSSNWNNGKATDENALIAGIKGGLKFRWYNESWVIGAIRDSSTLTVGFGIGMLNEDNTITPLFRLSPKGLYINEVKIT